MLTVIKFTDEAELDVTAGTDKNDYQRWQIVILQVLGKDKAQKGKAFEKNGFSVLCS